MNSIMNRQKKLQLLSLQPGQAVVFFDLSKENDREAYIDLLKQLAPHIELESQIGIDALILAAGGEVDHEFPGCENMPVQ